MKKLDSKTRVAEVAALADTLLRLWDAETGLQGDAFLQKYFARVKDLGEKIVAAIKRDRVQSGLDEADSARDEVLRNLSDAIEGYAALPVASIKEAAQGLKATFDKYGRKIAAENYLAESALVESLLQDLKKDGAAKAAASLAGIGELVSALEGAQAAFERAYDEFSAAKVNFAQNESATALKRTLVAVLNEKIVLYLTAMCDEAGFEVFVPQVSAEIEKINALAEGRAKASAKDAEAKVE